MERQRKAIFLYTWRSLGSVTREAQKYPISCKGT